MEGMASNTPSQIWLDCQKIISAGSPFTDPDFPPDISSLFDPRDHSDLVMVNYESVEWKRASEIFPQGLVVFPRYINADDLIQGSIGDCYFMSCLAALAANPKRITKLIRNEEPNAAGCYVVCLCINGTWQDVVIDDYLPVKPGTDNLAFGASNNEGHTDRGVLWVALLEKAWAKLCGNYDRIVMGTVDMGFIHLCGVPSIGLKHALFRANKNAVWNKLEQAQRERHIMTAGTSDNRLEADALMGQGLIANHCYYILSIHQVDANVRLLKIRNPWGRAEWTGDWSDASNKWTEALRNQVGAVVANDGIFYISLEDYLKHFSFTNICKYNDDDCHSYAYKNKPVQEQNFFEFELGSDFQFGTWGLEILVNQMGDRLSRRKRKTGQFEPSWFSIMLCRVEDNGPPSGKVVLPYQWLKSVVNTNYQVHLEIEPELLTPGRYFLNIEALWNDCAKNPNSDYQAFCVQLLSKRHIQLTESQMNSEEQKTFLKLSMASRSLQNSKQGNAQVHQYKSFAGSYKIVESYSLESLYGSIVVFNESDQPIHEEFKFDELKNFKICGPCEGRNVTVDAPPGKTRAILLKRQSEDKASFHFGSNVRKPGSGNNMFGGMGSNPMAGMETLGVPSAPRRPNQPGNTGPNFKSPGGNKITTKSPQPRPNPTVKKSPAANPTVKKSPAANTTKKPATKAPAAREEKKVAARPAVSSRVPAQSNRGGPVKKPAAGPAPSSRPGVEEKSVPNAEHIRLVKSTKTARRKELASAGGKQLYITECDKNQNVFVLLENEDQANLNVNFQFTLDGYKLVEPNSGAPNFWSTEMPSGSTQIIHLTHAEKPAAKKSSGPMAMMGIIDNYGDLEKSWKHVNEVWEEEQ